MKKDWLKKIWIETKYNELLAGGMLIAHPIIIDKIIGKKFIAVK